MQNSYLEPLKHKPVNYNNSHACVTSVDFSLNFENVKYVFENVKYVLLHS